MSLCHTKKCKIVDSKTFIELKILSRYICEQCDYKATQKGNLLRHIESIHEGVKCPCEQCDYKATCKESLLTIYGIRLTPKISPRAF